jgi:high affinity Mn2+ porin
MSRLVAQLAMRTLCVLLVCSAAPHSAHAQVSAPGVQPPQGPGLAFPQNTAGGQSGTRTEQTTTPPDPSAGDSLTLFPHSDTSRYWISGQANIILQWHPAFPAKYSGRNSLRPRAENATSKLYTLDLGYQLTPTTEVFLDAESAGGHGLSEALGLAGFTNLDVVRNPELSAAPYLARFMLRQIIPLGTEQSEAERGPLGLAASVPTRRIEFRIGKFSLVDFFDVNAWGADSHLQFLNWTVDNNGAYDYAANTRGYTDGVLVEYDNRWSSVRFAETLMPKVANGIRLDANITRARAENLEFEARGKWIAHRAGVVRLLGYLNHADMGNYAQAIGAYLKGKTPLPDITLARRQGRHRYGFGLNFEQALTPQVGVFGRLGWSDGRNESFAYTEVDRTLQLGAFTKGDAWHRRNDRAGAVLIDNGIVVAHQRYLALGGLGFLLGDGGLMYGPEKIFEGFYTVHLWRGFFASFDIQHVNNPGYNKDRGPVTVPALRFHADF